MNANTHICLAAVRALFEADSRIHALAIGGSVGAGFHDEFSDTDLFAICSAEDLLPLAAEIPKLLAQVAGVLVSSQSRAPDGFGELGVRVLWRSGDVCEVFLLAAETTGPHPFRLNLRPLFDKTGQMRSMIRDSTNERVAFDRQAILDEIVARFCFDARKLLTCCVRGSLWNGLHYVDHLRSHLLGLVRVSMGVLWWPDRPLRRYEEQVGESGICTTELEGTVARHDQVDLLRAFDCLMAMFRRQLRAVDVSATMRARWCEALEQIDGLRRAK